MVAVGWWRRRSPLWALARSSVACARRSSSSWARRAVVTSDHRGHVSVVTADAAGKAQVVAERVRWLMDGGDGGRARRVLVLTGSSRDSELRARLQDSAAFYELERQGHGIFNMHDFCRIMLEETGRDPRVVGRAKLAAFLLHHRQELPFGRLHRGNATSSLQQYRHVSDLLQLFRVLELNGVTMAAYLEDARTEGNTLAINLAETYAAYQRLLAKHGITSWSGMVLELLQLCGGVDGSDEEFVKSLVRGYTDIVVDNLQSFSPAMVHLVGKLCSSPGIQSSMSISRVLDELDSCPRALQLDQLLVSTQFNPSFEVTTVNMETAEAREPHTLASAIRHRIEADETEVTSSQALKCLAFRTVTEEELAIGQILREKLETGVISARQLAVLAPTLQDAQRIALALRVQGLPVHGMPSSNMLEGPAVIESGISSSINLFEEPVVNAVFSLLVALNFPSDSRHLYNVLRSDFFAFPPELLSRLMEKEQRSHVDLFHVLENFVDSSAAAVVNEEHQNTESDPTSLETARAFIKLVKNLRSVCHSQSAQEVVHTFLEETGRMESLLNPGSTEEEHDAIVLAEFLRELEAAQNVVQSPHIPIVVPYLMQLREANRVRNPATKRSNSHRVVSPLQDGADIDGEDGIRVLPLTITSLESLADLDISTLVLMSMRDSKFPGRMRRITLPLPYNLLSKPYPVQSRDEHIERCERLAALAVTIPRDQVVLSYAAIVTTPSNSDMAVAPPKTKVEQISRVLLPIWHNPTISEDDGFGGKSSAGSDVKNDAITEDAAATKNTSAIKYSPPHLSYTQISEYLRCPYRYYLSRIMKLPGEVSTAMVYGRALHEAIAEFASSLISAEDSEAEIDDEQRQLKAELNALATFQTAWKSSQEEAQFTSSAHENVLYEQGVLALKSFFKSHSAEKPRILHVEHPFSVFVPEADVELRGVWDRIDAVQGLNGSHDRVVIKEFKSNMSGSVRDVKKQSRESLQLKIYMYAYERVFGSLPFGAALQFIGADDKSNASGFITSSASSAQEAVETITETVRGMRAGEFSPRPNYVECAFCPYATSACRAAGDLSGGS